MNKLVLYGGSTALLIAYLLGRRHGRSALGSSGISQVDYTLEMPRLGRKAAKQIALAQEGKWLADYRKAEDLSSFWSAPAYNTQAYYAAAYWMAVAARLLHSRTLAAQAAVLAAKGSAVYAIPGSSLLTGSVGAIMKSAAATIRGAGSSRQVDAILAAIGQQSTSTSIATARQAAQDRGWAAEGAKKTGEDLVQVGSTFTTLVGNPVRAFLDLDVNGAPAPATLKWGTRIGVGVVAALLARWYFRPQITAIRAVIAKPAQPKQIEEKSA